jgi:hypothetical protein
MVTTTEMLKLESMKNGDQTKYCQKQQGKKKKRKRLKKLNVDVVVAVEIRK